MKTIEITPAYLSSQGLSETFPQRFWAKVNKNGPVPKHRPELGPCWVWTGGTNEHGYGIIGRAGTGVIKAHRAAWILEFGAIPEGVDILHCCDNPPCVRGDHLFSGDAKINGQDAAHKHRTRQGEHHWNCVLTETQVLEIRAQHVKWTKNHAELAARYGISVVNLQHILYRRSWKHI